MGPLLRERPEEEKMKKSLYTLCGLLLLLLTNLHALPFTTDFESGDLRGWSRTGTAFTHQPTLGDNVAVRKGDDRSNHQGRYWIGTYERYQGKAGEKPGSIQGDGPTGRLLSTPFILSSDRLSFLVGGGEGSKTRVELAVYDPIEQTYVPVLRASGSNVERMRRVVWRVAPYRGKRVRLQIIDEASGPWGHINADDFRFYNEATAAFSGTLSPAVGLTHLVPAPPKTVVPDLRKLPLSRAEAELDKAGLERGRIYRVETDGTPAIVLRQKPTGGTEVAPGSSVDLWVSAKSTLNVSIDPPSLSVEEGEIARFQAGANRGDIRFEWIGPEGSRGFGRSFEVDTGKLLPGSYEVSLLASDGQVQRGATARLKVVVKPKPGVVVPDLVGEPLETAKERLEAVGLRLGEVTKRPSGQKAGTVLAQHPAAGLWLKPSERVDLVVAETSPPPAVTTFEVRLQASDTVVSPEKGKVRFTASTSPVLEGVLYRFHFGDDSPPTGWSVRNRVTHRYRKSGRFEAYVEAAIAGRRPVVSEGVVVTVEGAPEAVTKEDGEGGSFPLWIAVALGTVAAGAAGVYLARRFAPGPRGGEVTFRLEEGKIESRIESQSALVERGVSVACIKDRGRQRIEVEGEIVMNEREES